jgi:hypothetical protein
MVFPSPLVGDDHGHWLTSSALTRALRICPDAELTRRTVNDPPCGFVITWPSNPSHHCKLGLRPVFTITVAPRTSPDGADVSNNRESSFLRARAASSPGGCVAPV